MSDDRTIRTQLVFEPDTKSQRAADQAYDAIQKNLDELVKLQAQFDKETVEGSAKNSKARKAQAAALRDAIKNQEALRKSAVNAAQDELRLQSALRKERDSAARETERAAKQARKDQERFNDTLRDTEDALADVAKQTRRQGGGGGGLLAAAEAGRSQATSRGVGALGDVDTALSTFASATGQNSLRLGADLFAVAEQFELLRGSAQAALPQLAAAAGPVGLGAMAVGAAAFAVTAVVLGGALQDANEDAKNYAIQLDAERAAREEAADLTTEETRAAIAAKNATIERTRAEIALLEAQQQGSTEFERNISRWTGVGSRAVERANDVAELEAELVAAESAIVGYTISIIDGTAAANDAAEAARALTESRVKELDAFIASQLGVISALEGSSEAAQKRLETIDLTRQVINLQIAQYRELGQDTTALTDQLQSLGFEEKALIEQVIPVVEARERETEAAKRQAESIKKLEDARFAENKAAIAQADALAKAEIDLSNRRVEIAEQAAQKVEDALDTANQKTAELQRDLGSDLSEIADNARKDNAERQLDLQRELLGIERDTARKIADIRRNAQQTELDLIENRDFGALARLKDRTDAEIDEARRGEDEQRTDAQQELEQANADAARAFQEERANRIAAFNQAQADAIANYNKQIEDARRFYDEQQRLANESFVKIAEGLKKAFEDTLRDIQFGLNPEAVQREIINQRAARLPSFSTAIPQSALAPRPFPGGGFGGSTVDNSRAVSMTNNFSLDTSTSNLMPAFDSLITRRLREVLGT